MSHKSENQQIEEPLSTLRIDIKNRALRRGSWSMIGYAWPRSPGGLLGWISECRSGLAGYVSLSAWPNLRGYLLIP